jgi:hypothetical protein
LTSATIEGGDGKLNLLGGDLIVIKGSNLPETTDRSSISIALDNTLKTKCDVLGSTSSEIRCLTLEFDQTTDKSISVKFKTEINGQAKDAPGSFTT